MTTISRFYDIIIQPDSRGLPAPTAAGAGAPIMPHTSING